MEEREATVLMWRGAGGTLWDDNALRYTGNMRSKLSTMNTWQSVDATGADLDRVIVSCVMRPSTIAVRVRETAVWHPVGCHE